jgi:DNA-binding response OmpR family regulator
MKKKILVIDDEEDISRLIKINLVKIGYEVIVLNNSKDAIEVAKKEVPDAITLDIMMPGLDGFQVLKSLKSTPETKDIPVIMVSVVAKVHRDHSLRLGAVDFVTKPINFDELYKKIENIISKTQKPKVSVEEKKILVVDDEVDVGNFIKRVLESKGLKIDVAYSGRETLSLVRKNKYSLILLDLYMPEIDGFTVLQKLKMDKESADIPVIVITARDTKGLREKCLFLGANQYITKPLSTEVLVSEITKYLEKI